MRAPLCGWMPQPFSPVCPGVERAPLLCDVLLSALTAGGHRQAKLFLLYSDLCSMDTGWPCYPELCRPSCSCSFCRGLWVKCPVPAKEHEASQNHLAVLNGFSTWPGLRQFPRPGGTYMRDQTCSVLALGHPLQILLLCCDNR